MDVPNQNISSLKRLPIHAEHEKAGARFGVFGEWYVPLYYTSILEEHETVRTAVGVFDISHMGEFLVRGKGACQQVNHWVTNDVEKLSVGGALYSPVCRENGGIVDDIVVFELDADEYLLIVNAANIEKDFAWFRANLTHHVSLENVSDEIALFAVQGPYSRQLISAVFPVDLKAISYYHFVTFNSSLGKIILSETGYTGEEGFEVFCPVGSARQLWQRLFEAGKPLGLKPIGFGARDTLRLEARFPLYGHDLSDERTPLEAGLGWTVDWEKKEFVGKEVLQAQRLSGVKQKLVGFEVAGRGIAREGCSVRIFGKEIGLVTSGTFSPTLKKSIGLAYIDSEFANVGQNLEIGIRGKNTEAKVVKTPFYKRSKAAV